MHLNPHDSRELQEDEADSDDVAVAMETYRSASDSSLVTGRLKGRRWRRNQETEKPTNKERTPSPWEHHCLIQSRVNVKDFSKK